MRKIADMLTRCLEQSQVHFPDFRIEIALSGSV